MLRVGQTQGAQGSPSWSEPEAPRCLCIGYANDYLGYIAPPSAWEQGGYEVGLGMWSILGPEAYGLLLDAGRALTAGLFADGPSGGAMDQGPQG